MSKKAIRLAFPLALLALAGLAAHRLLGRQELERLAKDAREELRDAPREVRAYVHDHWHDHWGPWFHGWYGATHRTITVNHSPEPRPAPPAAALVGPMTAAPTVSPEVRAAPRLVVPPARRRGPPGPTLAPIRPGSNADELLP